MNRRSNSAAAKNIRRIMHPRKQPGKGKQPCQACHPPASGHTIPQKLKGHGRAVHGMIARKDAFALCPVKFQICRSRVKGRPRCHSFPTAREITEHRQTARNAATQLSRRCFDSSPAQTKATSHKLKMPNDRNG